MDSRALAQLTALLAGRGSSPDAGSSGIAMCICEATQSAAVPLAWVVASLRRTLTEHPDQARDRDLVVARVRAMVVLFRTWPPMSRAQVTLFFGNLARLRPCWSDMRSREGLIDLTSWWASWTRAWAHLEHSGHAPEPVLRQVLRGYRALGLPDPEAFVDALRNASSAAQTSDPVLSWVRALVEEGADLPVLASALGAPDALWDEVLGIDTAATEPRRAEHLLDRVPPGLGRGQAGDGLHYQPAPYAVLARAAVALRPWVRDAVVDLGSGAGRTLCLLEREGVGRAWGIELDPALVYRSMANTASLDRVEIVQADLGARELDPDARRAIDEGTTFTLYNPFGAHTLGRVLEELEESLRARPRRVRLVYLVSPREGWLLDQVGWLRPRGEVAAGVWVWENTRKLGARVQVTTSTRSQVADPSPSSSA